MLRGYTDSIADGPGAVDATRSRTVRRLTRAGVAALLPYPVAPIYVVLQDTGSASTPARLPPPQLGNGPHLGYAVQWFSFALIGLVGTAVVLLRTRQAGGAGATAAKRVDRSR
jgi:cytochrome oxidase assembly protein ShyY1